MSRHVSTPGELSDLAWSAGHPLQPHFSTFRRWSMACLLVLVWTAILSYWVVTDSRRVRVQAEEALSKLVGGRVEVKSATMSIFEGLRLDDVQLSVYGSSGDDRVLFTAGTFLVEVDLRRLMRGQIQPRRIIAIDPIVRLTENRDLGDWNYHRLKPASEGQLGDGEISAPARLPEVILRNARVEYARIENGQMAPQGSMSIEAQLAPDVDPGDYRFRVQSRGESAAFGPQISGKVRLATREVEAQLSNFKFGQDVKTMLPDEVQRWWENHQLAGRVDVPRLSYIPGGASGTFTAARVVVDGVTLTIQPDELQSSDEIWRRKELDAMFDLLRAGGVDASGWITRIQASIEPEPITLSQVRGTFTFTPGGIELSEVVGYVEGNAVRIDGMIHGYTPDAPADLMIASLPDRPLVIPPAPRYINTLPPQARETYDHLRPAGKARMSIRLQRDTRGGRVDVAGDIEVIEGGFTFDKFPYPVSRASGRIVFGPDPSTGQDKLELLALRGFGVAGGPNAQSPVQVDGVIAPLTPDAGVDIRIRGQNISSEPVLMRSFPPLTRRALRYLDAPGAGEFPRFIGDFVCEVFRPVGPRMPWTTRVDIDIRDAEGALVAFPYHLSGVSGTLKVRDDHVQIVNATMKRDGATLTIDGRVDWGEDEDERDASGRDGDRRGVRPDLRITAVNAPIDQNLLDAMPETHRSWLQRLGVQGRMDLSGTVTASSSPDDDTDFDFAVTFRDGALWPNQGTFALGDLRGDLRLRPQTLEITRISGRRGDATVTASGRVAWPNDQPSLRMTLDATNLALDQGLYGILPGGGREGWDLVRPEGTVDARIALSGEVSDGKAPDYTVTILPRKLSVTPTVFPVRFADVTGKVTVTAQKVDLVELIARRGESRVTLGGGGDLTGPGTWNLTLSADRLNLDEELTSALPPALGEVVRSTEMRGAYDVTFSKLRIVNDSAAAPDGPNADVPTTAPGAFERLDFACRLETRDGAMTAGVPMKGIVGFADFAGSSRRGRLGDLVGKINLQRLSLGELPVESLTANLHKTEADDTIRLGDLRCALADGHVAGQIEWVWPQDGPPRYGLSLVVRDADVTRLGVESAAPGFRGRMTASLALEGTWESTRSRRGRGDVLVEGRNMYRIPLLLGLMQITNLSLPVNAPFTQASARYGVEGDRVTFESVELSAEQMKMSGSGYLDFGEKVVRMTFVTDSTTWPNIPIVGDLLRGARHELLQIHVRGSLQEPKVTAGSMRTITTTIDEVFRGDRK